MDARDLAKLEQLARLKASGALSEEEFTAAKVALLNDAAASAMDLPPTTLTPPPAQHGVDIVAASATWRFRFDFMNEHGLPRAPTYQAAYRALPWGERSRLRFSLLGFLLGPFYLLYLGLWRSALSLTALAVAASLLVDLLGFSDTTNRALAVGFAAVFASTCIPLYYLKVTLGTNSWNPFCWLNH